MTSFCNQSIREEGCGRTLHLYKPPNQQVHDGIAQTIHRVVHRPRITTRESRDMFCRLVAKSSEDCMAKLILLNKRKSIRNLPVDGCSLEMCLACGSLRPRQTPKARLKSAERFKCFCCMACHGDGWLEVVNWCRDPVRVRAEENTNLA